MMTYRSNEIKGRAKVIVTKHGAYLNPHSQPCKRHCPGRSEDCHGKCKDWKEWEQLHRLAMEEQRQIEAELDISSLTPKPKKEWDKYRIPNKYMTK